MRLFLGRERTKRCRNYGVEGASDRALLNDTEWIHYLATARHIIVRTRPTEFPSSRERLQCLTYGCGRVPGVPVPYRFYKPLGIVCTASLYENVHPNWGNTFTVNQLQGVVDRMLTSRKGGGNLQPSEPRKNHEGTLL